jgi:toxin CcdB
MAQFDVYRMADGVLVLDLQSDELYLTNTRIVAPLVLTADYEKPIPRANPELTIDGEAFLLLTHFLSAVQVSDLRQKITNLDQSEYIIKAALDMLFYGF